MATFTYGNLGVGVDMSNSNVEGLLDYDFWRATSTKITVSDNASNFTAFTGSGFKVTQSKTGTLTDVAAGTLTGIKIVFGGETGLSITGLKLSAAKVADTIFGLKDAAFLSLILSGNDTVNGTSKADKLLGGAGSDVLKGNGGGDKLLGGAGVDDLFGGTGADRFVFTKLSDSGKTTTTRDTIFDFSLSQGDRIDLAAIDANTKTSSVNDAFKFIGSDKFSGKAGELRFELKTSDTYVYVDVNGDKVADLSIHLDDRVVLHKADFVL
jgi:serralysin